MAVNLQDNIEQNAPKLLEAWQGPYNGPDAATAIAAACAAIQPSVRLIGRYVVLVINGVAIHYHFKSGIADSDLVPLETPLTITNITTGLGFTPENTANKNVANGYAGLDSNGKVLSSQWPSGIDEVIEYPGGVSSFPATGSTSIIYLDTSTTSGKQYRWSGSTYIAIIATPGTTDAVAEGTTNLYFTAARVLATLLTGIGFSTVSAVVATDTILQAIGKLQAQLNALFAAGSSTTNALPKYTGANSMGNSQITDDGTNVSVGSTINLKPNRIEIKNDTDPTRVFDLISTNESVTSVKALIVARNNAALAGFTENGQFKIYNLGSGNDEIVLNNDGSASFAGAVVMPTQAVNDNTTKGATTAYVQAQLLVSSPVLVASGNITAQTNWATICTTVVQGNVDKSFQISGTIYDCNLGNNKFAVQVDWTNPSGVNQSAWLTYSPAWGTNTNDVGANGLTVDGAMMPVEIRAKAQTGIALKVATSDTPGAAYPGGTYSAAGRIYILPGQ